MKLTNRSEYALVALSVLARNFNKNIVSAEQIALQKNIPKGFLQQILFSLKKAGYVRATKGKDGGYSLVKAPKDISIAEIVRFFEGPLASSTSVSKNFYHPSPIEEEPGIVNLLAGIRDYVAKTLEATTLEDVVGKRSK